MIKLTKENGKSVFVSTENIGKVETADFNYAAAGTQVSFHGEMVIVKESPEEVVRKIMDYKMGIMDFQACLNNTEIASTADSVKQLYKLAGLEQTP